MTAADLNALAKDAAAETSRYELLTNQAQTSGQIFDHMAPLPVMPDHRHTRSWEPAARRFKDLTDEERERIG